MLLYNLHRIGRRGPNEKSQVSPEALRLPGYKQVFLLEQHFQEITRDKKSNNAGKSQIITCGLVSYLGQAFPGRSDSGKHSKVL